MMVPHFDTDRQTVVLCGAGHVSAALCTVLQPLGWQIAVIDDRKELLTKDSRQTDENTKYIDDRISLVKKYIKDNMDKKSYN